jgi:hypothetical protein
MSQFSLHKITIGRSVDPRRLVNILDLSRQIEVDPEMIDSLIDLLFTSFETDNIGVDLPSRVYLLVEGKEVIASVFLTTTKDALPQKYQAVLNGYYIYNVCTAIPYRGQGLMKNLLHQILLEDPDFPDLVAIGKSICYPSPVFYLKVAKENTVARNLYSRLGFRRPVDEENEEVFEWTNQIG